MLDEWDVPRDAQRDALLVVTELATNAVMHAESDYLVVLHLKPDTLGIAVADSDSTAAEPRDLGPEEVGGRGLHMVDAVAAEWGTANVPDDGKFVWVQIRS